ncbi:MAG TPA: LysM domain-containing protein [Streptosporangiaceae bacterium]|nr:LysM domain-containing protein [Streptosporangiaceae bacterium]
MRVWTKSACAVLAWGSILVIVVVASGMSQPVRPAQANIRIASSTTEITRASMASVAAALVTASRPAKGYVVQSGDTLSGIAARLAVLGGWPALYAANRPRIGPDPDVIRPGTVLVLPGRKALARYTVAAGDTLAAIAAALAVPGGWPALYAANRSRIGPDPGLIRPGTVLAIPRPVAPSPPASRPGHRVPPPPPSAPAGGRHGHGPGNAVLATGMPGWLKTVLLAAGLLIGAAFLAEPMLLALRRRRQQAGARANQPVAAGQRSGAGGPGASPAGIVVADHDRLVVTRSQPDDTVYVLRPPGQDPGEIMRVARLVLPEDPYRELAAWLGMPASWPIVLADHDQVVVTRNQTDGTVYVLRPPGQDPREILRVARLVLPEALYGELADLLGVPASWPMKYGLPVQAGPAGPWRPGERAVPGQQGSPRCRGWG